jgi:hypothetical protein
MVRGLYGINTSSLWVYQISKGAVQGVWSRADRRDEAWLAASLKVGEGRPLSGHTLLQARRLDSLM